MGSGCGPCSPLGGVVLGHHRRHWVMGHGGEASSPLVVVRAIVGVDEGDAFGKELEGSLDANRNVDRGSVILVDVISGPTKLRLQMPLIYPQQLLASLSTMSLQIQNKLQNKRMVLVGPHQWSCRRIVVVVVASGQRRTIVMRSLLIIVVHRVVSSPGFVVDALCRCHPPLSKLCHVVVVCWWGG